MIENTDWVSWLAIDLFIYAKELTISAHGTIQDRKVRSQDAEVN